MFWRMLKADLRRSRVVSLTLAALIAVSAVLGATSASLVARTFVAIDDFWSQASPPDVVQMHSGEVDASAIEAWVKSRDDISDHHVLKTLPIPGSQLYIDGISQADSVLEPALVQSPDRFDLLLDPDGNRVDPQAGEVWLPVHYQVEGLAKVGSDVKIKSGSDTINLKVAGFARDAQMNPSMVTSKRLVVNQQDFLKAEPAFTPEYLIEFQAEPGVKPKQIQDAYASSGLPAQGIAVDSSIFRLLNALSTMLLAATIVMISLLLIAVAALALRFAFLAAFEQDLSEIAALKAIGAPGRKLKGLFLIKYAALTLVGVLVGFGLSWPVANAASKGVEAYLGHPQGSVWLWLAPLLAALAIAGLILASCWVLLRRIGKLSTTEALRSGSSASTKPKKARWKLAKTKLGVPEYLGLRGALRPNNTLLGAVVVLCTFVMIVPTVVASTVSDERFSTYLGVGQADVRIDVRDGGASMSDVESLVKAQSEVERHVVLQSSRFDVKAPSGEWETLMVEMGDHEAFPLQYEEGSAPTADGQISLSHNEAKELGVSVGEPVTLRIDGAEKSFHTSGVYQDITNGGKTAKATFTPPGDALWNVVYLELKDGADAAAITEKFKSDLPGAKVTLVSQYASETMGATTSQMSLIAWLAGAVALCLVFLIVTLFVVLVVARERGQIAAQRALGMDVGSIQRQYYVHFLVVSGIGILLACLLTVTLGEKIFQAAMGMLGAPGVNFLPDPLVAWVLLPLAMLAIVVLALYFALRGVRAVSLTEKE